VELLGSLLIPVVFVFAVTSKYVYLANVLPGLNPFVQMLSNLLATKGYILGQ
jgi:hypothetical protein